MNIEETKKAIEVMQAYVDGKNIECSGLFTQDYLSLPSPNWNWEDNAYRVKQPRWIDITVNEALDLLQTGPQRARFSDDKKNWAGSENYHVELTGLNLLDDMCFLERNVGYRYCQILEED